MLYYNGQRRPGVFREFALSDFTVIPIETTLSVPGGGRAYVPRFHTQCMIIILFCAFSHNNNIL